MAGTTSYVDIGATQRKEGGSGTAKTSYVDIGAAQRQEAASGGASTTIDRLMTTRQIGFLTGGIYGLN